MEVLMMNKMLGKAMQGLIFWLKNQVVGFFLEFVFPVVIPFALQELAIMFNGLSKDENKEAVVGKMMEAYKQRVEQFDAGKTANRIDDLLLRALKSSAKDDEFLKANFSALYDMIDRKLDELFREVENNS